MRTSFRPEASALALLALQACTAPSGADDDSIGQIQSAMTSSPFIGTFNSGSWFLDASRNHTMDFTDRSGNFGQAGDLPFVYHRFSLLPATGIAGIFRNGTWCFDWNDSLLWDTGDTCSNFFGQAGDRPIVGRWFPQCFTNECIGVYRNGTWFFDTGDKAWENNLDLVVSFGPSNALPITGSWRKTPYSNIGYFKDGNWVLDTNGNMVEEASDLHGSFGLPGDLPIAGDWDGDGIDNVGILRPSSSTFCLDMNGNANWEAGVDVCFPFGTTPGNMPVVRGQVSSPSMSIPGPQIIACRYTDSTRGSEADLQIVRDALTATGIGKGGMYDYLKAVTYGKMDLDFLGGTFFGWYTINRTSAQGAGQPRATRLQWCLAAASAAGLNTTSNSRHLVAMADGGDDGNSGLDSVLSWDKLSPRALITYGAHEILHQYGLEHSWGRFNNEYGDPIDVMSGYTFGGENPMYQGAFMGDSGPSLNAGYRFMFFNPSSDDPNGIWEASFTQGGLVRLVNVNLVALDHPEVAGSYLMRILVPNSSTFFTIELREKSGWDRAIANAEVAVRIWNDALGGTVALCDLTAGQACQKSTPFIEVAVNSIDTAKHVANLIVKY